MTALLYVLAATVSLALNVIYFAMFLYAILSWFMMEDAPMMQVLAMITAPVILPVRAITSRIPALQNSPVDFSFLIAFVLLLFVMNALPPISFA